MNRKKLEIIYGSLEDTMNTAELLGKNDARWVYLSFLADALRQTISALLEDDKSKTAPDLVIPEERRRKRIEELTRKISKYRWTPEEVKAVKESLLHWRDNVSRLKLTDEMGLVITRTPKFATWEAMMPYLKPHSNWEDIQGCEKIKIASFGSSDCALCGLYFYGMCEKCPISEIGNKCTSESSVYCECSRAKGNEEIIKAAENMVKVLESLLE